MRVKVSSAYNEVGLTMTSNGGTMQKSNLVKRTVVDIIQWRTFLHLSRSRQFVSTCMQPLVYLRHHPTRLQCLQVTATPRCNHKQLETTSQRNPLGKFFEIRGFGRFELPRHNFQQRESPAYCFFNEEIRVLQKSSIYTFGSYTLLSV